MSLVQSAVHVKHNVLIWTWKGLNFGWTIRLTLSICFSVNFDGFWRWISDNYETYNPPLACSAGIFIWCVWMVLIAKAPCWNSRRQEEMSNSQSKHFPHILSKITWPPYTITKRESQTLLLRLIGWFSSTMGTSVDNSARRSNNLLDRRLSGNLGSRSRV